MTNPTALQRLEGFLLLGAAIWMFAETGESWWLFGLLLLAPDVSMLGYLRGPELGAVTYNLGHILLGPAVLKVGTDIRSAGWELPTVACNPVYRVETPWREGVSTHASPPVSRILSRTVIHLGPTSP